MRELAVDATWLCAAQVIKPKPETAQQSVRDELFRHKDDNWNIGLLADLLEDWLDAMEKHLDDVFGLDLDATATAVLAVCRDFSYSGRSKLCAGCYLFDS